MVNEPLGHRTLLATIIIASSVALINLGRIAKGATKEGEASEVGEISQCPPPTAETAESQRSLPLAGKSFSMSLCCAERFSGDVFHHDAMEPLTV